MYKVSTINAHLNHDTDSVVVVKDGQAINQVAAWEQSFWPDGKARIEKWKLANKLKKPYACTDTVHYSKFTIASYNVSSVANRLYALCMDGIWLIQLLLIASYTC